MTVCALLATSLAAGGPSPDPVPDVRAIEPAGLGAGAGDFHLLDAQWTTAHIHEKGVVGAVDTGLVVTYLAPKGRNPYSTKDWIGIYPKGKLNKSDRIDWDWVCPNEESRCLAAGAAAVPAGDNGMRSGQTYTVAYWLDGMEESAGSPAATIEYVVPW
ncbi:MULTISPECIES: hypothetical protein [unclassified Streptomyces]|uniref:hypothetical protein n=1 Tax=unclassified Streptomyces TaxID=2593676 RepID=UPI001660F8F1|nr:MULTISPECIES: hypothetical protein [unclassified Streptomyces]MBD0710661.1 hypothetical protein [Streptomyces sp. CBMA291]MBD0715508.1 hypothetical protein [Streptomyces sp. CBMA370]